MYVTWSLIKSNQSNLQLEDKDEGSEKGEIQQAATQPLAQQLWTSKLYHHITSCPSLQ